MSDLSWSMEGVPVPHRGKRTDLRREWALCALRVLFDKIDADEQPIGMAITTVDAGGVATVNTLARGSSTVERYVVTDVEALEKAAKDGFIGLLHSTEWYHGMAKLVPRNGLSCPR